MDATNICFEFLLKDNETRARMEIPCNESMLDVVYTYQASTSKSTRILHLQKRTTKAQDDQILTLLKLAQKH